VELLATPDIYIQTAITTTTTRPCRKTIDNDDASLLSCDNGHKTTTRRLRSYNKKRCRMKKGKSGWVKGGWEKPCSDNNNKHIKPLDVVCMYT